MTEEMFYIAVAVLAPILAPNGSSVRVFYMAARLVSSLVTELSAGLAAINYLYELLVARLRITVFLLLFCIIGNLGTSMTASLDPPALSELSLNFSIALCRC